MKKELPLCGCGCGNYVTKPHNKYILGHHTRVIDCAWNRGLTKKTDTRVLKQSKKITGRTKENHPGVRSHSEKMRGRKSPFKGKPIHSKETLEKLSNTLRGLNLIPWNKGLTKETSKRLKNVSDILKGKKRGSNKYPFSDEVRKNQRLAAIKRIEKYNGQLSPAYNPNACKLIDKYGNENGYNFQHAENGGEFHIKKLGYWVDGYDKEKNIVIEIDERHHFDKNGNLLERDIKRQKEITELLKCKFIRLKI